MRTRRSQSKGPAPCPAIRPAISSAQSGGVSARRATLDIKHGAYGVRVAEASAHPPLRRLVEHRGGRLALRLMPAQSMGAARIRQQCGSRLAFLQADAVDGRWAMGDAAGQCSTTRLTAPSQGVSIAQRCRFGMPDFVNFHPRQRSRQRAARAVDMRGHPGDRLIQPA
jgi:hypothetical protein